MRGPNVEFRSVVADQIDALHEAADPEALLEETLSKILGGVSEDRPAPQLTTDEDAYEELAAIETWASLASHAVQELYAPSSLSLFGRKKEEAGENKLAGWAQGAAEKLRRIADKLRAALIKVARRLHCLSFSVGVNYPWGVSIGIAWTP
jgi:hypothetical protein